MLLIYVIVAAAIPAALRAVARRRCKAFAFLFGIGLGGDYMIIPLMAAELFGVARPGPRDGHRADRRRRGRGAGPMVVAALRDYYGAYGPGFGLLLGLAVIGAVAVAALPRTLLSTRQPATSPAADATA